jgi:anthranilate phosphoribosyltransferase
VIKDAIAAVIDRKNLTQKQAYAVMKAIMDGQATPSQIAGFLTGLRMKSETIDEIAGCALAMRDAATPVALRADWVLDNCGTGGDGKSGLNISTAAAFLVAGAGFTVAKHGNRAISSKSGSADVLEMMGVRVDAPVAVVEHCVNGSGIGFMFAPNFHPAMKHAMPTRRELGVRTVFNLLGPLTNPARAKVQLIGVFNPGLTPVLAQVMARTGQVAGLVVHSEGWDEITLHGKTKVSELLKGKVRHYTLTAADFGLPKVAVQHLKGGDAAENAERLLKLLRNEKTPVRPVVLANAGALIWIAERARGAKLSLRDAVKTAEAALANGKALACFQKMAELSHAFD